MLNLEKRSQEYNQLYFKHYGIRLSEAETKQQCIKLTELVHLICTPPSMEVNLSTINKTLYAKSHSTIKQ